MHLQPSLTAQQFRVIRYLEVVYCANMKCAIIW